MRAPFADVFSVIVFALVCLVLLVLMGTYRLPDLVLESGFKILVATHSTETG